MRSSQSHWGIVWNSVDEEQKVRVRKVKKEEWDAEKEDGCQAMLVPRGHGQNFGL